MSVIVTDGVPVTDDSVIPTSISLVWSLSTVDRVRSAAVIGMGTSENAADRPPAAPTPDLTPPWPCSTPADGDRERRAPSQYMMNGHAVAATLMASAADTAMTALLPIAWPTEPM